ncbi:hypothetical protein CAP48_18985 [Advenella sp. S44]|uniref:NAD(P)/FAD-dependent oxidoreductase n=1 Tax=Advenella sp. S44 TaxID=1982755 RepID=UPI000C2A71A6|nr:FAD-dependent oxidoreductase [Advenella sp. S44]PJX20486.1 hypothetical protein CAP48_18985 [Advenella sp. S44]
MSRVVIVGGGHSGVELAFSLRQLGYTGAIAVLEKSSFPPYERPPMSKSWISGTAGPDELALRNQNAFAQSTIDLMLNCEVNSIDRKQQTVTTNDGVIEYSVLVLALGSSPRQLRITGSELSGLHQFHTLEHALALRDDLARASRIAVIGAGFIGLEFASAAAKLGKPVVILETAARVMPRTASELTASYVRSRHEVSGTDFRFNASVLEIRGQAGRVKEIVLSDGTCVEANLVVQGIGANPNGEWTADLGLNFDNGIVVDTCLRTNDPNIYAIGDCARFVDEEGRSVRLESIGNACDHARRAAAAIANTPVPPIETPWFWSNQAGVRLQMAGRIDRVEDWLLTGSVETNAFSMLGWRNRKLVYGESVNCPGDHVVIRNLLATDTVPTPEKLKPISGMGLKAGIKFLAQQQAESGSVY